MSGGQVARVRDIHRVEIQWLGLHCTSVGVPEACVTTDKRSCLSPLTHVVVGLALHQLEVGVVHVVGTVVHVLIGVLGLSRLDEDALEVGYRVRHLPERD